MAGRGGRGRGRSNMTFSLENLGIGRGEALPPSSLQPSPLFPPMTFQPVPLQTGEEVEYMLALKQELRAATKNLPYYIRQSAARRDVLRYSDKYHRDEARDSIMDWRPDWSRLPNELCIKVRKSQKKAVLPQLKGTKTTTSGKEEVLSKLEFLEKKEEIVNSEDEEDEEKKKTNEEEEQEQEEELDEEEVEEETDYIMSYFDNGEDFGVDSDDNMDEATY
ncbi:DNA-directed RNA polymerase III subunit RPC7-like isoform X1 [Myripristis murdjan]|uniref:DNA-directed RNA polymerase III subunit RPC7-like isoform X1 n=1 Tax=Myripristis murdjan TaxID=586833 RepID=UPI00117608A0|nr:DNA-directed RNA polymerase III subunit RPC7-like isoform X1 [Myripristis murdjan]XP_029919135.1 DNA-directed RNA polymerase III subunit RPC7-like isoform X1 [Myripristis murdjan]